MGRETKKGENRSENIKRGEHMASDAEQEEEYTE